jgi:hypothetical protein
LLSGIVILTIFDIAHTVLGVVAGFGVVLGYYLANFDLLMCTMSGPGGANSGGTTGGDSGGNATVNNNSMQAPNNPGSGNASGAAPSETNDRSKLVETIQKKKENAQYFDQQFDGAHYEYEAFLARKDEYESNGKEEE